MGKRIVHDGFPERLRRLMEKKNVSRYIISQLCGLDSDMIRRYEKGVARPRADSLAKIADYFGVSMDYLYGITDNPGREK